MGKIIGFLIAVLILVRVLNPKPMAWRGSGGEPLPEPLESIGRIFLAAVAFSALYHLSKSLLGK